MILLKTRRLEIRPAVFLLLVALSCCACEPSPSKNLSGPVNDSLYQAWQQQRSDVQLSGSGVVTRVLSDDTKGSRHQRFILKINAHQTILIAHNIDLAPRITGLREGDVVEFYGEYEWNKKGGVVHWTHKDPNNRHAHGWLRHRGKQYW